MPARAPSHAWSAPIAAVVTLISRRTGTSPDRCATRVLAQRVERSLGYFQHRRAVQPLDDAGPMPRRQPVDACVVARHDHANRVLARRAKPFNQIARQLGAASGLGIEAGQSKDGDQGERLEQTRRAERFVSVIGTRINDRVDQQRGCLGRLCRGTAPLQSTARATAELLSVMALFDGAKMPIADTEGLLLPSSRSHTIEAQGCLLSQPIDWLRGGSCGEGRPYPVGIRK